MRLRVYSTMCKARCLLFLFKFFNDISSENDTPSGHLVETSLLCGTQGSLYWLAGLWLYKVRIMLLDRLFSCKEFYHCMKIYIYRLLQVRRLKVHVGNFCLFAYQDNARNS